MQLIDKKARKNLRPYIIQSVLATCFIFLILVNLDVISHTAIIATLGSSAFLVFTRPRAYASRLRPLLGGYLIGTVVGVFCFYLSLIPGWVELPLSTNTVFIIFGAMAVGASIFFMVVTNTEHAPAAGMSLGMVINTWDYRTILYVLIAVLTMALLRHLLKRYMIDLI